MCCFEWGTRTIISGVGLVPSYRSNFGSHKPSSGRDLPAFNPSGALPPHWMSSIICMPLRKGVVQGSDKWITLLHSSLSCSSIPCSISNNSLLALFHFPGHNLFPPYVSHEEICIPTKECWYPNVWAKCLQASYSWAIELKSSIYFTISLDCGPSTGFCWLVLYTHWQVQHFLLAFKLQFPNWVLQMNGYHYPIYLGRKEHPVETVIHLNQLSQKHGGINFEQKLLL